MNAAPETREQAVERIRAQRRARLAQIERLAERLLAARGEVCASDVAQQLVERGWLKTYARAMVRRHLRSLVEQGRLAEGELRRGPCSGFPRRYFKSA